MLTLFASTLPKLTQDNIACKEIINQTEKKMTKLFLISLLTFSASLIFGQANKSKQTNSKPFVLGVIDEIDSKELNEKRILNIYLPEGYDANDTTKYPVIYLLDGSADEDFIHIVGLVQFNSFEWINQVPKSIVVGIASVDRRRDFTFPSTVEQDKINNPTSGQSHKFMSFLENELQPYIDENYKTNKSKTLIGQSLGGLLATEILFKKPALFTKYIIVSPSLWWDNGSLLNQSTSTFENTDVYIGVGKEGLAPSPTPHVMEVDANLLADKLKKLNYKNVKIHFDYLPSENHATILHQAVSNAFKLLYPIAE
jgi:predicted alpha/beta superfamily hydrolase